MKKCFRLFAKNGIKDDFVELQADDKKEAYYLLIEEFLGIRLSIYQTEDVLKNLSVGNKVFDLIDCEEVLP